MPDSQKNPDPVMKTACAHDGLESMYRAAIETSPDGFHLLDAEGRILEVNNAYVKRSGYTREELLAMRITDLEAKESPDGTAARIKRVIHHGSDTFESFHRAKDGMVWQVEVTAAYGEIEGGRFFCFLRDITERKRAEQEVRESGEKFRAIYEHIGIGVALIGRDMQILSINPQMQKWFPHIDLTQHHICYQSFNSPPQDNLCSYCPTVLTLKDGQVHTAITDTPTPDGMRNYRIISTPLLAADGSISAAIEMVEDITERRKLEKELEQFRTFFQTATDLMCIADPNGAFLQTNPACSQVLGYSESELISKPFIDFIHPEDKQSTLDEMARQIRVGASLNFVNRYICKDGSFRVLSWRATFKKDEGITYAVARDITDQRQAHEALAAQLKFNEGLLEAIPIPVFFKDTQGRYLGCNQAFTHVTGVSAEELVGKTVHEVWPGEQAQIYHDRDLQLLANPHHQSYDFSLPDRQGTMLDVIFDKEVFYNEQGQAAGIVGSFLDITERKKAEEQLKHSLSLLGASLESTADGILVVALDGKIVGFNEQFAKLWNIPKSILDLHNDQQALDFVLDQLKNPEEFIANVRALYATPEANSFDILEFKDGRRFERYSQPQQIDGCAVGRVWSFRDITRQYQTANKLLESEERFRLAMQGAADGLWDWNLLTDDVYYSPRWKSMLGYAEDELENTLDTWKRLVSPDDQQRALQSVREAIEGHTDKYEVEFHMLHRDGRYLDILSRATLVRGVDDKPVRLVGTHVDITERKRSEEALRQNEQFIRNILDTVDEGFIVVDRDYRILTANKAYCSQVGGCAEQVIGSRCYEISHKASRPCFEEGEECATRHAFETGTPHTALHRHKDAKGNTIFVETKAFPLKDGSGVVTSVIEVINNITEKYLLEEERLKTQKLESIGTLAGGIAHDFNNLLQGVFGYISMAKITHDQKEKSLAMLSQAEEALHTSVNLTTQLLTFSKGGKPVKKLIRLEPTIENAVKFALSGSSTDYRMDIDSDLWSVEADAGQLTQVIQNIVLNANEAMAGRGTIRIAVRNFDIPANSRHRLLEGGRFVYIRIQDTGTGISAQNLTKIFDPYFTTKQKGSGLGLATSYSIIRNHGGIIDVKSELDGGSIFTVYLPASRNVVTVAPTAASPAARTKKGRVLLMDDEELVRAVAREMIVTLGHEVEDAADGGKAIELFSRARDIGRPFDLVILDLTVKGGMSGEEAIVTIRDIDPQVKAVVSSGYADSAVVADYRTYGFSAVLNKPYRMDDLLNCLNHLIA